MSVRYESLREETLADIVCCPGGLEIQDKSLTGHVEQVLAWRRRMIRQGLEGVVAYNEGVPRGFAEIMPAEGAPLAVIAPGTAVLMCYHWAGTAADDPEHLSQERALIEQLIHQTSDRYAGLVTQGWDHPSHFPIHFLEEVGFQSVDSRDAIALMWHPFRATAALPSFAPPAYAPQDRSTEGVLAIDAAFSARCPYGLHFENRLRETVDGHPRRDRIELILHRIDNRAQALALALPPFDWSWVFFNSEEVDLFSLPGGRLSAEISRRIDALEPA
jgi:hypothetical protein